jgi:hypothetical protein
MGYFTPPAGRRLELYPEFFPRGIGSLDDELIL